MALRHFLKALGVLLQISAGRFRENLTICLLSNFLAKKFWSFEAMHGA
jgi:hypothetical protein